MDYPQGFKDAMVRKMTAPGRRPTVDIAEEMGLHPSTLSRWVREAGMVGNMSQRKIQGKPMTVDSRTPEEKLQLVLEASVLRDDEMGAFLRENSIHQAHIDQWQKDALAGLSGKASVSRTQNTPDAKRIRELEKELQRKDKALASAAALIILKKKADALWGVEDDDME
jgi:transposase